MAKGTVGRCRCVCGGKTHGADRPPEPRKERQLRLFADEEAEALVAPYADGLIPPGEWT